MLKSFKLAAFMLPVVFLANTGCKSNSSNPEQASQPPAQTAPAAAAPSSASSMTGSQAGNTAQPAGSSTQAPGTAVVTNEAPPPPPPPPPIVIPAGTVLHVRLVQAVGSKISEDGQRFEATLSSPVSVKGERVISSGTRALGTVTEAHASGRFKGGATLALQLNSIVVDGKVYPIRTAAYTSESKGKGKRTTAMIGGGAAGGALIGGLAGGGKGALIGGAIGAGAGTAGAATGNRDITLASETPLSFRLSSSLTLPPGGAVPDERPQP